MYCSHCGAQITEATKFCPERGAGNQATQTVTQPSNQPLVVNVINSNNNTNTNVSCWAILAHTSSMWAKRVWGFSIFLPLAFWNRLDD